MSCTWIWDKIPCYWLMQLSFKSSRHWNMKNFWTFVIIYAHLLKVVRQGWTNCSKQLYHTGVFCSRRQSLQFFLMKIIGVIQSWNEEWVCMYCSYMSHYCFQLFISWWKKSKNLCSWRNFSFKKRIITLFFIIPCCVTSLMEIWFVFLE